MKIESAIKKAFVDLTKTEEGFAHKARLIELFMEMTKKLLSKI